MKSLFVRGYAAMSLVAAFMFFGCSDDSSPVESDEKSEALSSSAADELESSSSAKLDENPASSSSEKVSSSSAEEESSSSSKNEEKSSSSSVEDEESSSSSLESSSSSESAIVTPVPRTVNIIASQLSSRVFGNVVRFTGRFGLDMSDSTAIDGAFDPVFTSIEYKVAKGADVSNMVCVDVAINFNTLLLPTQDFIDLNSMNSAYVSIDLLDPGFTECGLYSLIVSVTAYDGEREFMRTEIISFERDAYDYCSDLKQ